MIKRQKLSLSGQRASGSAKCSYFHMAQVEYSYFYMANLFFSIFDLWLTLLQQIWSRPKRPQRYLVCAKRSLIFGPKMCILRAQIIIRITNKILTELNILFNNSWTDVFMDVLDRTKFDQISRTFWQGLNVSGNILDRTKYQVANRQHNIIVKLFWKIVTRIFNSTFSFYRHETKVKQGYDCSMTRKRTGFCRWLC